jgi:predicted signal transduction protein with EAL and GGDEF domain
VLLCEVAKRLKHALREEDTLARLGGDEFLILFPELRDKRDESVHEARAGAERIQKVLSSAFGIRNQELHISASIGIAMFPEGDADADDIIQHADIAMYRVKDAGRNAIRFFLPSMQIAAQEQLELHNALRRALDRDELRLYFQPQVDLAGNIIGAEALLRWESPERGLVSADSFIAAAEQSGQILALGQWVLERALAQLKEWCDQGQEIPFRNMSINVSARQFYQPDFALEVERILKETGADPTKVTLEVTEGCLIESLEDAVQKIYALKRLGVRFSIDDFGTGYSSLAYLKRLPLDELKIDRSFVHNMAIDSDDARLVETIVKMADHMGLSIVAEGVETAAQLALLRSEGCQVFQGFHFCAPQPLKRFAQLLKSQAAYCELV